MQSNEIGQRLYGGEFGDTLEQLKARVPFTQDMQGLGFEGDTRKIGAVLLLAGVAGELIERIEELESKLAVASHSQSVMEFFLAVGFDEELAEKLDTHAGELAGALDGGDTHNPEEHFKVMESLYHYAKENGLWPRAEVPA